MAKNISDTKIIISKTKNIAVVIKKYTHEPLSKGEKYDSNIIL